MMEVKTCDIGKELRRIRIGMEIGFRQLAQDAEIALSTLWAIETGRASPSIETLVKIGKALNREISVHLREASASSPSSSLRAVRQSSVPEPRRSLGGRRRTTS